MTDNPMTMEDELLKHEDDVNEFYDEILSLCLGSKYSNDVIRDGLEICLNFIRKEIYKARRENLG